MLFKKRPSKAIKQTLHQELIAKKIANKIIQSQLNVATYLNKKTAHFSKRQKQILLIGISIFFSAISLYLLFSSLN